ncbi:PorP/SprF family type IX secretion system membrane protein [Pleomorphovibrio marinus]|uniref:PorP/SprF family type IX secretion system membrane protein n=1 Tax=Pleomorphovibrio marinus TaxID=2164132 RepID=UPI001E500279|nr:type IX secretion system membrane protein PorP/SprF [Pleomorphovibrio marinus]
MKLKALLFVALAALLIGRVHGQADPKLSVYMFNPMVYNPAFAGAGGGLSLIGIHSSQFVGFEGAPNTQYFSAHGLWEEDGVGLGLDLLNDSFGMMGESSVNANFAYYLRISERLQFSFGMKAGANQYRMDYSRLNIQDPDEDILVADNINVVRPNLGLGFYLFSDDFYIGISTPGIAVTQRHSAFEVGLRPGEASYYLMTGMLIPVSYNVTFMPNLLVRTVNGAPRSGLLSMSFDVDGDFFLGANYEYKSSVGIMAGTVFAENFKWGYAYDLPTHALGRYSKGTHTVFVSYQLERFKKASNMPCFYY